MQVADGARRRGAPHVAAVAAALLVCAAVLGSCGERRGPPPAPGRPPLAPEVYPLSAAPLLDHPGRDAWQRPDAVVAALDLRAGDRVADVGCGTGYFTQRLLRAVGPDGHVLAVDVQQGMLDLLAARLGADERRRVTLRCNAPERPLEPTDAVDLVFCANTLKEVPDADAGAFVRTLAEALTRGGRLAVVDWLPEPMDLGPPVAERISPERVRALAEAAGLVFARRLDLLPTHSFQIFTRPR